MISLACVFVAIRYAKVGIFPSLVSFIAIVEQLLKLTTYYILCAVVFMQLVNTD